MPAGDYNIAARWAYASAMWRSAIKEPIMSTGLTSIGSVTPWFDEKDTWAIEAGDFKLFHIGNEHYICVLNGEEFNSKSSQEKKIFIDGINRFLGTPDVMFMQNLAEGIVPYFTELEKSESFKDLLSNIVAKEVEKEIIKYLSSGK